VILPQLVLLQKTLLNIEGLGRRSTRAGLGRNAKPFIERWIERAGDGRAGEKHADRSPKWAACCRSARLEHQALNENRLTHW